MKTRVVCLHIMKDQDEAEDKQEWTQLLENRCQKSTVTLHKGIGSRVALWVGRENLKGVSF